MPDRTRDNCLRRDKLKQAKHQEQSGVVLFLSKQKISPVKKLNCKRNLLKSNVKSIGSKIAEEILTDKCRKFRTSPTNLKGGGEVLKSKDDWMFPHSLFIYLFCHSARVNIVTYTEVLNLQISSITWKSVRFFKQDYTISYSPCEPKMNGQTFLNLLVPQLCRYY